MSSDRSDHVPIGEPCERCGLSRREHRVRHVYTVDEGNDGTTCDFVVRHDPIGDPCRRGEPIRYGQTHAPLCGLPAVHEIHGKGVTCGLPRKQHRVRQRSSREREKRHRKERDFYCGVDGEGESYGRVDRATGTKAHRYRLLCAESEDGTFSRYVENDRGLSTVECLDFLLSLPAEARTFGYGFGYDVALILKDLDEESQYLIARPEDLKRERDHRGNALPIRWQGYRLNLIGGRLTIQRGKLRRVIWDVRKFFQGPFVDALEAWKVGSRKSWRRMRSMKKQRDHFRNVGKKKIRSYCQEECRHLAELVHKLDDAHEAQGLTLRAYFGAGSSGAAMLDAMGVKDFRHEGLPEMAEPIAAAFFGGRFENSTLGPIEGPIHSWDINSAYPFRLYQMPCLTCGRWRSTTVEDEAREATAALVRYELGEPSPRTSREKSLFEAWGPLPFRQADGSIVYPASGSSGWIWRDEFFAAKKLYPHAKFREAWIYTTTCSHRPFEKVPTYYRARLKLGAEAAGLVLKLALNSCFGKTAQSIGRAPPFQCWIWAGMVTSGCRAQILDIIATHRDAQNVLSIATDGIQTLERITPPEAPDTGTSGTYGGKTKPLGAWDAGKPLPNVFFASPGVFFPENPTKEQIAKIRARGVGRRELFENSKRIIKAWRAGETEVTLKGLPRFHGLKTSLHAKTVDGRRVFERSAMFGRWSSMPIVLQLTPGIKREEAWSDDEAFEWERPRVQLSLRRVMGESLPYARALGRKAWTTEQSSLRYRSDVAAEQPDVPHEEEGEEDE